MQGLNFELTYDCPLRCGHCLQAHLRTPTRRGWADPRLIRRAIREAADLDLLRLGVNFTGGEIVWPGSPLPELLALTGDLGIPTRVNTNGWWGRARRIRIGDREFPGADAALDWLQASGVAVLALSFDRRYRQYPNLWRSVTALILACERRGLTCELLCLAVPPEEAEAAVADVERRLGRPLTNLQRFDDDLVDLGAAATGDGPAWSPTLASSLAARLRQTPCQLRGLHRPWYLHVAPDGGVRSCMVAAGGGWLGHLRATGLAEIVAGFPANPVARWFAQPDLEAQVAALPASVWERLHGVRHPCALAALVASSATLGGPSATNTRHPVQRQ